MFLAVIFHLLYSVTPDFVCLCVKCILLDLLHILLCVSTVIYITLINRIISRSKWSECHQFALFFTAGHWCYQRCISWTTMPLGFFGSKLVLHLLYFSPGKLAVVPFCSIFFFICTAFHTEYSLAYLILSWRLLLITTAAFRLVLLRIRLGSNNSFNVFTQSNRINFLFKICYWEPVKWHFWSL